MIMLETLSELAHQLWGLWLMLAFLAIAFWAFRPANKRRFERDAQIPLKDDHPEP
jgi:cytochrome c oxidase cbb3-type subunit IV